ncbi:MAG: integrase family protein [Cyanobacteria bacterium SZAS-4]|nr:integrase family protein [Cyanobacteria bacterium SZAS-4]
MPNINKTYVEEQNEPGLYADEKLTGFRLKVTPAGKKVYLVYAKVKGNPRPVKVTIGQHGDPKRGRITAEQARTKAIQLLGAMRGGTNPNLVQKQERRKEEVQRAESEVEKNRQSLTLGIVFADFLASRNLKPGTKSVYTYIVNSRFKNWLELPLLSITKDMVERRHKEISIKHPGDADGAMRVFRAVWRYAQVKYEDADGKPLFGEHPVKRLSQVNAWNRLQRRQSIIKDSDLKAWYSAVMALDNDAVRDYLRLLLLTGMRKEEGASLTWGSIDLHSKTLKVLDTKNRQQHMLPLSQQLYEILLERWQTRTSDYVFPGRTDYVRDVSRQVVTIIEDSKVPFMLHDLRRTFATTAAQIATQYELKKILNHKDASDVTSGYIVADAERLRPTMQKISDVLLINAGVKPSTQQRQRKSPVAHIAEKRTRKTPKSKL